MTVNLPTNMLRSFVAIVETGSMLNASEQVFVTQSALSLQIKRLEELVQQHLFLREGRRLTLTSAGEVLLGYARRILALHDEAVAAITTGRFEGPVRIGMVQDFAALERNPLEVALKAGGYVLGQRVEKPVPHDRISCEKRTYLGAQVLKIDGAG